MKKILFISLLIVTILCACNAPHPIENDEAAEEEMPLIEITAVRVGDEDADGLLINENRDDAANDLDITGASPAEDSGMIQPMSDEQVELIQRDDGSVDDGGMIQNNSHSSAIGTNVSMTIPSQEQQVIINNSTTVNNTVNGEELPTTSMIQRVDAGQGTQMIQRAQGSGRLAPLAFMPRNPLSSGQAIQFGWGETSAVVTGTLPAGGYATYNLYAMVSQNFLVVLESDNGSAVLGVSDDRGQIFADPSQGLTAYSFYLPRTATYYVDVYATNQPVNFRLQVFIPARVNIPQGQNSAVMTGSVGPYGVVSYNAYIYAGQTVKIDDYSGPVPTSFLRVSGMETGQVYLDYTNYCPSWYAIAPVTQDYLIEVITLDQPSNYRLTVFVQ